MFSSAALPRLSRILYLATVLAWCGPLNGCTPEAADTAADEDSIPVAERYGGTAVLGIGADLQTMNSLTVSDAASREVQVNMLLMPLVLYGADRAPHPWLAERWDTVRVVPDSLDLIFHLRRDVQWHDGVPTTAADVLFTYDRAIDPRTGSTSGSSFRLWSPAAEVVDSFTIRFRLRPHEEYLSIWASLAILPEHLLGEVPPEELARHAFGHTRPVGNGPFRFTRRDQGQQWVFDANPDFPEALGGRPYLDRIVLRVIPDATARLTELLTGGIDVMSPSPSQLAQIQSSDEVRFVAAPSRSYVYLGWNTHQPLFQDARVRRALSLGLDRQAIVDALLYGQGEVGVSTSTPLQWLYDDDYRRLAPRHDPEEARRLLQEAGWTLGHRQDDTPYFHTSAMNGPYAETGFTHPRVDALIDTLNVLMDRDVARPLWQEYHTLLLEHAPFATLMYPNLLLAHSARLRGVEFDFRGGYAGAPLWWIDPRSR